MDYALLVTVRAMQRTRILLLALAAHPCTACGPFVIDVDLTSGGTGGPIDTSTSHDDGSSGLSASDSDGGHVSTSDTGTSTGPSAGTDASSGTTGELYPCVLPHDLAQSWCASQRLVAQAIDCRTPDGLVPECYQTIVAQYTEGVWELVQAGDCSTAIDGPECEEPYMACTNASGPNDCTLGSVDSLEVCLTNAEAAGLSSEAALPWCQRMIALWVDGCTTTLPGEPCETSCAFPCSHGMACTGEPGAEVCT